MAWIKAKINSSNVEDFKSIDTKFNCKNRTVFHSFFWLFAFKDNLDFWYYKDMQDNLRSIFIFIESSKNYTKGLHIPPFTQYFSPLFADEINDKIKKEVVDELINELKIEKKLQVLDLNGDWVHAPPIEDTLVVNVGDLLSRWTNGIFRSTPHRVVNRSGKERLSLVLAYDPSPNMIIDPHDIFGDQCATEHKPITCGDYLTWRFEKSFS